MRAAIKPSRAVGQIYAPTSKSMAHRLLIAAALCEKVSTVRGITYCEDVLATVDSLRALGAEITLSKDIATVRGIDARSASPKGELNCRESGSTLRFLIPIAALSGKSVTLCGSEYLMTRPLSVYEKIFEQRGLSFEKGKSLTLAGPLTAGEYRISGSVSSQFITGLLFALPLLDGDSKIIIEPPFESRSYVELTLAALRTFGVRAEFEDELTLKIFGSAKYLPADVTVEGDWSGAAFLNALNAVGGDVSVMGLKEDSYQGDRISEEYFKKICKGAPTLSVKDCPDLAPILMALGAAKHGVTLTDTARLKLKESDRGAAMADALSAFGAEVQLRENSITVNPCKISSPKRVINGHNDHRIVMSCAILLTLVGGEVNDAEAIAKSYPDFFEDIKKLGINVSLYE